MNKCKQKKPWSPWDDRRVKARLKEGRSAWEIELLMCPACGQASYYNKGSHFTCGNCGTNYTVLAEGEYAEDGASCVWVDDSFCLGDYGVDIDLIDDPSSENKIENHNS